MSDGVIKDLISQFVKATNDNKDQAEETTSTGLLSRTAE